MESPRVPLSRREGAVLASLCLAAFMIRLDGMIVSISLPTLSRAFDASTSQVFWIVLSYLLVQTGTLLLFGRLGESLGQSRVFLAGFGLFTLASLACGLAPGLGTLVAARLLQGLGGAMLMVAVYASIPQYLPTEASGYAFALVSAWVAAGVAVGAPLGGIITGYISWRWIFLVNVPVGCATILLAAWALPKEPRRVAAALAGSMDFPGTVSSLVGLVLLVYGLNMGDENGWGSLITIASLASSALLLAFFAWRELRTPVPMLDLRMFKDPELASACAACLLVYVCAAGNGTMFPFYLELAEGLEVQEAGFVFLFYSVVFIPASVLLGKAAGKLDPHRLTLAGLSCAAVCAWIFFLRIETPSLMVAGLFLAGLALALALFLPVNNRRIVTLAPDGHRGEASGVLGTMQNLGMTLGACVAEALFSGAFYGGDAGTIWKPARVVDAGTLRGGFGRVYVFIALLYTAAALLTLATRRAGPGMGHEQGDDR